MIFSQQDKHYMERALKLAKRGIGKTRPNPAVGCVLVKDGHIIGEGYHRKAGESHAEIVALNKADNPRNATCYVTLEPCNHFGRTPPCTHALVNAGIKRVVIAMSDPNGNVQGGGVQYLRNAGIEVQEGLMENSAREINASWIKWAVTGLPYIVLKMGMSLDGKIATRTGASKWITGEKSREHAHRYRANISAIMVGSQTLKSDNPRLTARKNDKIVAAPDRIITSTNLDISSSANIFQSDCPGRTILICAADAHSHRITHFSSIPNTVVVTVPRKNRYVDLHAALKKLGEMSIELLLVEGGPTLAYSFLNAEFVDRMMIYIAPKLIGGWKAPSAIGGDGFPDLSRVPVLKNKMTRRLGNDILVEGNVAYASKIEK